VDPLAGSYFLENLTDQIEARAQDYIDQIDRLGGAVDAIEKGFVQKEIGAAAYRYQQEIEKGERVVVGLNRFQVAAEEKPSELLKVDPAVGEKQVARLWELKASRNNVELQQALFALKTAAQGTDNLMPPILRAVKAMATLGEICDTLREVFGEYEAPALV
jgi:methylmalonyl-CoA mutase N-terminal domain/subunit